MSTPTLQTKLEIHAAESVKQTTIPAKTTDYTLLHCLFDVTKQKPSPFYDQLAPSPPNTMLNICQILMTHKATLIGGGVGEVSFRLLQ